MGLPENIYTFEIFAWGLIKLLSLLKILFDFFYLTAMTVLWRGGWLSVDIACVFKLQHENTLPGSDHKI